MAWLSQSLSFDHPLILLGLSLVLFAIFCAGCLLLDAVQAKRYLRREDAWPRYDPYPPRTFSQPAVKGIHRPSASEFDRRRAKTRDRAS